MAYHLNRNTQPKNETMKKESHDLPQEKQTVDHSVLASSAAFCRELAGRVRELKAKLLEQFRNEIAFTSDDHLIYRAIVEAEALAWLTPYPHLFLPVLAEEKVQSLRT